MGLGKRLGDANRVRKMTFYLEVIGKDVKRVTEAKYGGSDQKTLRKCVHALTRDLNQLGPSLGEIVASVGSSDLMDYHAPLLGAAETYLIELDAAAKGSPGDVRGWDLLHAAMRDWCQRLQSLDMQVNPKGGNTTRALGLLSSHTPGYSGDKADVAPDSRPRFAEMLTAEFMGRQVEKRLMGKSFVRVAPMLSVCAFLFEQGAVLGSAYRDRLQTFIVPFCSAVDNDLSSLLANEAQRLASVVSEVESAHQLCVVDAMRKENPSASTDQWASWLLSKAEERTTPEEAFRLGVIHAVMGAGFGAHYSEQYRALYDATYPEYPFEQRLAEANSDFADLCRAYFPEVMNDLFG